MDNLKEVSKNDETQSDWYIAAKPKVKASAGREIDVFANHFKIKIDDQLKELSHYDMKIERQEDQQDDEKYGGGGAMLTTDSTTSGRAREELKSKHKVICKALIQQLIARHKDDIFVIPYVHDGRASLYTRGMLNLTGQEQTFRDLTPWEAPQPRRDGKPVRIRKYQITLKYVRSVAMQEFDDFFKNVTNFNPLTAIQALDIALRFTAMHNSTQQGRSFFSPVNSKPLNNGKEIWFGYHQSLRTTQSGLTLNIDSSATLFIKTQKVTDYLRAIGIRDLHQPLSRSDVSKAKSALKNLEITVTHRKEQRKYKILAIGQGGYEETFKMGDGDKEVSISDYFKEKYPNYRLQYPELNVIQVHPKKKRMFYPMEVCMIVPGQSFSGRLSTEDSQEMIKNLCCDPAKRRRQIEDKVHEADLNGDSHIRNFGMKVSKEMTTLKARVLPAPSMRYGSDDVNPNNGSWNLRGVKFIAPATLSEWGVVAFNIRETSVARRFIQELCNEAPKYGVTILDNSPPVIDRARTEREAVNQCYDVVRQKKNGKKPQIIFIIKDRDDAPSYNEIKFTTDTMVGVPSQVLVYKNLMKNNRINPMYLANVLLKVNMKLGGRNAYLDTSLPKVAGAPTMIIGADVSHPGVGERWKPSLAAVTTCVDMYGSQYIARVRQQDRQKEIIAEMRALTAELLLAFHWHTGEKPRQIIVYRDGLGDGQYKELLEKEIAEIRKACDDVEVGYSAKVRITVIIVRKRHHTRFFPARRDGGDRTGNVPSGTVVDSVICHPRDYDFYLCSHGGLKGTSRPTYYTVVVDEIEFTADQIQSLTFMLCHMFTRCTKAVSVVAPVYYAHLAAFRARCFIRDNSDTSTVSSGDMIEMSTVEDVHEDLKNTMYFV